jgi:uncharacterized protein RhaS with RHS repeats
LNTTGYLFYRNRYYDPALGLFIADDPLGDAQRYVGNNPLGFTDPLGLNAVALQQTAPFIPYAAGALAAISRVAPALGPVGIGVGVAAGAGAGYLLYLQGQDKTPCQVNTFATPRGIGFTGAESKQNSRDQNCDKQYQEDTTECSRLPKPNSVKSRCYLSASTRYGECLAGKPYRSRLVRN